MFLIIVTNVNIGIVLLQSSFLDSPLRSSTSEFKFHSLHFTSFDSPLRDHPLRVHPLASLRLLTSHESPLDSPLRDHPLASLRFTHFIR